MRTAIDTAQRMNSPRLFGLLVLNASLAFAGCANVERSRSLANVQTAAVTTAQQVCSNCHGLDGNSVSPNFPRLAGQTQPYLISQLKGFRAQTRADPAGFEYMWGLSRHLSDAQIEGLAAYYAGFPATQPARPPGAVDAATAATAATAAAATAASAGRVIFESGVPDSGVAPCSACHGAQAQGNGSFPRLANQHADYLYKQLMVFQRTDERPEGAIMKTIAHGMTQDHMRAVAQYLQDMPAPAAAR